MLKTPQSNRLPKLSIIVSTLNNGKKLLDTINSVNSQDYPSKELLIIDGLSSDSTESIIKEHKNKIDFYLSEKDEGIYDAWNKGIMHSNGDWISFLGAGDRFYSEKTLSSLLSHLKNEETNFISGIIFMEDSEKNFLGNLGNEWNLKAIKNNITIGHPGSLHHKSLFLKNGNFNKNYQICGDYEFLLRSSKSISAKFYPYYIVKMDNVGISNQKPFIAIYESAKAIYLNLDFGLYWSIRYTLFSLLKTIFKRLLLSFTFGEIIFKFIKREKIDK